MSNDPMKVEVRGIRELRSALNKVDKEIPKAMKDGFKEIAESVAAKARSKVPRLKGNAQASIKPRATQKGAGIAFGGAKAPYYPWLDFGGSTGRGHKNRSAGSGATKRPFVQQGRYIYPTIREENANIEEAVDQLLEKVIRSADFDTREGD